MSTEELEQFLRLDFQASKEGASDLEAIWYISNLLAQRRGVADWCEAWEQLQTQYLPCSDGRSLYEREITDEKAQIPDCHSTKHARLLSKIAALALAVVVTLLGGMMVTQATETDVLEAIATWTDETFHLITGGMGTDGWERSPQIEELLPTWHPNGFVPGQPEVTELSDSRILYVPYQGENRTYSVEVQQLFTWENEDFTAYEGGNDPERYDAFNRVFWIYSDADTLFATSYDGKFIISVSGMLTMEEIKAVLDSIKGPLSVRNVIRMREFLAEDGQTLYRPQVPDGLVCTQSDIWAFELGTETENISWVEAYTRGDVFYGFSVDKRNTPSSKRYEKDDGPVEEYVYHGNTHYIFTNINSTVVVWVAENVEYSISATKDAFDIKALIRSAYEVG